MSCCSLALPIVYLSLEMEFVKAPRTRETLEHQSSGIEISANCAASEHGFIHQSLSQKFWPKTLSNIFQLDFCEVPVG
jgi:hypothetical protein